MGVLHWLAHDVVAPAIVAVGFAGTTTFLIETFNAVRDEVTTLANEVRGDLRSIQILAVEYWARPRAAGDEALEARLIAAQNDLGHSLRLLDGLLLLKGSADSWLVDIFDALTGGDFQGQQRQAEPARIQQIVRLTSSLRSEIGRARLMSMSVLRLGARKRAVEGPSSVRVNQRLDGNR